MNANEVLKLIDAGFTAEEIRAMGPGQETDQEPAPEAPEAPESAPEEETAPESAPEQKKPDPQMDAIIKRIDTLTGSITTLLNRSTGARTPDEKDTVDDILAKAFFGKEDK